MGTYSRSIETCFKNYNLILENISSASSFGPRHISLNIALEQDKKFTPSARLLATKTLALLELAAQRRTAVGGVGRLQAEADDQLQPDSRARSRLHKGRDWGGCTQRLVYSHTLQLQLAADFVYEAFGYSCVEKVTKLLCSFITTVKSCIKATRIQMCRLTKESLLP